MFNEITEPLVTTEWGRRTGLGVLVGLSLLITYLLIETLSTWRSDFIILHNQSAAPSTLPVDDLVKRIAEIPEQHIFGKKDVLEQTTTLPITSLQLKLMGVVKSQPEKMSRVIISESNQIGKVYQVGDSLPSGVKIYKITEQGVVLENGGRLEKLPLQRPSLSFQGLPKPLLPD